MMNKIEFYPSVRMCDDNNIVKTKLVCMYAFGINSLHTMTYLSDLLYDKQMQYVLCSIISSLIDNHKR